MKTYKIAVAGTGYVGMSIATLLAQHHQVTAVDVIPEKVEKINHQVSPIQDEYIEKYLAEKPLNLTATLDGVARLQGCRLRGDCRANQLRPNKELFRHQSCGRGHRIGKEREPSCYHGHQKYHSSWLHRKHTQETAHRECDFFAGVPA